MSNSVLESLSSIVTTEAPILAQVLLGPFGGVVVSLLSSVFGADPKNVPELISKIQADPTADLKIKTLGYQHSENLAKLAAENYSTEVSDKMDARKYGEQYKDFIKHFAYLVTAGFFIALFLLFFMPEVSNETKQLLSMLVGMLVSKWQTIIDFFYGSSNEGKRDGF